MKIGPFDWKSSLADTGVVRILCGECSGISLRETTKHRGGPRDFTRLGGGSNMFGTGSDCIEES